MDYGDYSARLVAAARGAQLSQYGAVVENGREYPLWRVSTPGARELVVTSGFHGEEPAGPLTLLSQLPALLELARARGVGLRIFPCINPSGFEAGHRYNASGERPNNDFLRYELESGAWTGELSPGQPFRRWRVHEDGPKETVALLRALEAGRTPEAALDIHQDAALPGGQTYAYVFGPREAYLPLMAASAAHAQVVRSAQVDERARTDADGLIVLHDGSVTDYYHRRGVPYAAALETTTRTPLERSEAIHLIWLEGFLALAAGAR